MHKKLFIAVLALGLLLNALPASALPEDYADRPVKSFGSGQGKTGTPVLTPASGGLVTMNAGQNRTVPGTFCDGQYQGPFTYTISAWYAGNEFYAGYQDPQDPTRFGAVCSNSPSFDVTAINTILGNTSGPFPFTLTMQPLVFDVVSPSATAPCLQEPADVAGGASCVGPAYGITWLASGTFLINLPFTIECCQTGAYYAAWYSPTPGAINIGTDGGSDAGDPEHLVDGQNFCSQWNEYGFGWLDMDQFWEANFGPGFDLTHMNWSEGYTPDDPATHCNAGTCGYQVWYTCSVTPAENTGPCIGNPGAGGTGYRYDDGNDDWDAGFSIPSASFGGRTKLGARFEAVGLDTLKEVKFLLADGPFGLPEAAEDILVEIWAESPTLSCGQKTPGALVYSTTVLGNGCRYPCMLTVPIPDLTFGTLNGGPEVSFFATIELTAGASVLVTGDPETAAGCPANPFEAHSLAYFPAHTGYGGPVWKYLSERSNVAPQTYAEFYIDARICKEILPAVEADCGAGSPDQWSSFAHDAQQTSASTINVGDPNGVKLAWSTSFAAASNFTSPTIHNGIVYQSSDNTLNAIDITTGATIGIATGGPEMAASGNRGNATVAFTRGVAGGDRDLVFATGSTFNSVSAWETNLETSGPAPIWSRNGASPPSLGQQNRFNTCKVIDVAGTDVLFISTEPNLGTGRLWAIEAATGALYGGWATNPLILDAAAKHGPTYNNGKLYVATAVGGTNNNGSISQVDPATGVVDWTFIPTAGEGWPSGVSAEGDFLYGASRDVTPTGRRYKIDVSGAPAVVWSATQGLGLYGTPTVGRSFVYFPLDNPNFGILQVDKNVGTIARNFAASDEICGATVFMVPEIVALSCDAYLFAGDRNGLWWLLNAVDGSYEWYREMPSLVNGTALGSYAGTDYAVVSVLAGGPGGILNGYELNTGSRPRLIQCVHDVTIEVPFGTGAGNPHSEADALLNLGDMPLNVTSYSISDPAPDGLATTARRARETAASVVKTGLRYMNADGYYDVLGNEKPLKMAGLIGTAGGEEYAHSKFVSAPSSVRNSSRMAASASTMRTSSVTIDGSAIPTSIAAGASASLDWIYDGTGLERGIDLNVIELTNDDPDFDYDAVNNGSISVAEVNVLYVGGCAAGNTHITWNRDGADNFAKVFNHGAFGDQGLEALVYGNDGEAVGHDQLFDGGVLITGDSSAAIGGAELAIDYYDFAEYIPNPNPQGDCGFEKDSGLVLGAKRTGGCPGSPAAIHGMYVKTYYADSNLTVAGGTPLAAIGINVEQTEVGADDPLYGDFKLTRLHLINRDAVAKTVRAGTYFDWDVRGAATSNVGLVSDGFNGYAIWDPVTVRFAYGMLDVNQPSTYGGVDPTAFPPALIMSNLNDTTYTGVGGGQWGGGGPVVQDYQYGWFLANGHYAGPRHSMGGNGVAGLADDRGGFLVNELSLAASGSGDVYQANFAFNVNGNSTDAFVEAGGRNVAKRAARWAGFARGDVNDDGVVDLADVCWIQGGNPLYPDAYCGDVDADGDNDAADTARLLSYVSGSAASRPAGAWRFPW